LLCGLVAVPAAVAASRASGDGIFELRGANVSSAVITGVRGTVWGQMTTGKLVVTDPSPTDGAIYVTGAEKTRPVNEKVTVYSGKDIRFRVVGGKYKLFFKGAGIDLTAVGVGTALVTGDIAADDTGDYSQDDVKWTPVPYLQRSIPFGVQPAATTP
jgi:hypothetical protein